MNAKNKRRIFVGIFVIGILGLIVFLQTSGNVVYFYTPDEAQAKALELSKQTIRLGGMIEPGSVQWNAQTLDLKFKVTDLKGHTVLVDHRGTPPDMFKEGQGVVVEGRLASNGLSIDSKKLMVKHSEEYKKPGDHTMLDRAALEKSLK